MSPPDRADDTLHFLPESLPDAEANPPRHWKVMIVDDEPGVHAATRLALRDISFRGRGLEFVSAYSGAEAMAKLHEHPDTAMIFLDVVMESEDAGLKVARRIRKEGFNLVRIVLRTGHPGYAPERQVVVDYDIHDYKEKSSLDFSKLFSCLISALRAFDDLVAIEQHRRGLLSVLEAVSWFDLRSLKRYLSRMLSELSSLAGIEVDELLLAVQPGPGKNSGASSASEDFAVLIDGLAGAPLSPDERRLIADALAGRPLPTDATAATCVVEACGLSLALFTRNRPALERADRVLLELFLGKVAQALDNHQTFAEILGERDSLVRAFADPDVGSGGHDSREIESLQQLCRETAQRLQQRVDFPAEIDDWFVYSIGTAAGFHDLGDQAQPHALLEKRAPLSAAERQVVERHVADGVAILRRKLGSMQHSRLFELSQAVVEQHHERYDGSGYPAGLAGEAIALAARIVAVVDSFVAMTAARPHRPAWSRGEALDHLQQGRGTLFDPRVVDAFFDVIDPAH